MEASFVKNTLLTGIIAVALAVLSGPPTAAASPPPFVFPEGCCYFDGDLVRTVVPPAATPREGRDDFFAVAGGVADQKAIVAVAPGQSDYHGGQWRFHLAAWTEGSDPYLLTSAQAVLEAQATGDVMITRDPGRDFKCPIQP